uniref:IRS-type PTB domain-containing protein n=1 Tax=Periophthalmus magnuspinnatus TaxID=409849 RepID=A0A3B3Z9X6_9GOBI
MHNAQRLLEPFPLLCLPVKPIPGYLGKQEQKHRRYFVLRAGSHSGPSRLEWYKTQERFTAVETSAGETGLFGSHKKDYKVALYAKDQTLVFVGKDDEEQQEWYTAIKESAAQSHVCECTKFWILGFTCVFQVWPVTVKPRGLGRSKALTGEILLCLTASSLVLVRVGHDHELPSVTLPLLAVRRFGHLDGSFFLELGRSAPHGPGEIWMEARNLSLAQQIHEIVREAVRALRVIPDFNWSSSPSKSSGSLYHSLFALKRSRPKQREKQGHCRPSGPQVLCESLHSHSHSDPDMEETLRTDSVRTEPSSEPEAECYMEMKTEHSPPREGPGYVLMTPQLSQSLHQDDYVSMTSPQKEALTKQASLSFLQTSFRYDPVPVFMFTMRSRTSD